jgi:hypothetical protein
MIHCSLYLTSRRGHQTELKDVSVRFLEVRLGERPDLPKVILQRLLAQPPVVEDLDAPERAVHQGAEAHPMSSFRRDVGPDQD